MQRSVGNSTTKIQLVHIIIPKFTTIKMILTSLKNTFRLYRCLIKFYLTFNKNNGYFFDLPSQKKFFTKQQSDAMYLPFYNLLVWQDVSSHLHLIYLLPPLLLLRLYFSRVCLLSYFVNFLSTCDLRLADLLLPCLDICIG